MNSLTVAYGTFAFPVSPALTITRSALDIESEGGGTRETWRVLGIVRGATPQALEAARMAAQTALAVAGQSLQFKRGANVLRAIAPQSCRVTPRLSELRWDATDKAEFHGESAFTAVFEAIVHDNDQTVQHLVLTTTQVEDRGGRLTLITEGSASLRNDVSDEAAIGALTPPLADGFARVESRFVLRPEHRADFRMTDEAVYEALPGGVRDGHFVRTFARDAQGRPILTVAGFFIGELAVQRALELRPSSSQLIDESISENPFERRADFRFVSYPVIGESPALRILEQVTFIETRRVVDHKPKAPGTPTYRQETGAPDVRVIQEGAAIGTTAHPSPPTPLFPDDVLEREVRYLLPPPGGDPAPLETRWRYVCAPIEPVSFAPPVL